MEVELLDAAAPDPDGLVVPASPSLDAGRAGRQSSTARLGPGPGRRHRAGLAVPVRPALPRQRPPGHREPRREDLRGVRPASWVRTSRCWPRTRPATRQPLPPGQRRAPGRHQGRARASATRCSPSTPRGSSSLTGCRHGELSRRLLAGDREGAAAALRTAGPARRPGERLYVELQHHLLPDDDWLVAELARLAARGRAAHGRHQRRPLRAALGPRAAGRARVPSATAVTSTSSAHLRRPNAEYALKAARSWRRCRPGDPAAEPLVRAGLAGGHRAGRRARGALPGRPGVRALPLPGLPGARRRDALLATSRSSATTACGSATTP